MQCEECGAELPEDAEFCPACESISEAPLPRLTGLQWCVLVFLILLFGTTVLGLLWVSWRFISRLIGM